MNRKALWLSFFVMSWGQVSMAETYKTLLPLNADAYNKNAAICCFLDWGVSGWFSKALKFPEAEVYNSKTGEMVSLRSLVKDRPIVLEMGSVTCPAYDLNVKGIGALEEKYKGKVDFYTLYVRENHPNDKFRLHTKMEQKVSYAKELQKLSHIQHPILVDDVSGSLHQALGNFGNSVYLIGKDMYVNHWSIFISSKLLGEGIEALLAANGVAQNAKFVGGTDFHPYVRTEFSSLEKKETTARMMDRGDRPPSSQKISSMYDGLDESTKAAYMTLSKDVKNSFSQMLESLSSTGTSKKKFSNPFDALAPVHEAFRSEYRNRYQRWRKLNRLPGSDELPKEELRTVK